MKKSAVLLSFIMIISCTTTDNFVFRAGPDAVQPRDEKSFFIASDAINEIILNQSVEKNIDGLKEELEAFVEQGKYREALAIFRSLENIGETAPLLEWTEESLKSAYSEKLKEEGHEGAADSVRRIFAPPDSPETDLTALVEGMATIWADRGMKIENGYGFRDVVIGSGFFIHKAGYLLTNYHVIESEVDPEYKGYSKLSIMMSDDPDTKIPAEVIGWDPVFDIALLKADVTPEYIFSLSTREEYTPGEQIFAIGSPGGLEKTITRGILSAEGRRFLELGDVIQVDIPINPGNSGGPVLDSKNKVIGVVFAGIEEYEGVNFVIPMHYVNDFLTDLFLGGRIVHPWIGAGIHESRKGLEVLYVVPGGPADKAGLKKGDVIIELNGDSVTSIQEIHKHILGNDAGTLIPLTVKNGEKIVYCSLAGRQEQHKLEAEAKEIPVDLFPVIFGMDLEETGRSFGNQEYTVKKVYAGTIADEYSIKEGDILIIRKWKINPKRDTFSLEIRMKKKKPGFIDGIILMEGDLKTNNYI